MTIKNDGWIKTFGDSGGIEPFDPEAVNPASYDIAIGKDVILYRECNEHSITGLGELSGIQQIQSKTYDLSLTSVKLKPGDRALVASQEIIKTPVDVAVTIRLKSSLARQMIVAPIGLYIDPGYEGQITLCLINMGAEDYELRIGRRVGQLIFQGLSAPAEVPYGDPRRKSHYQGSFGVTGNKSSL